MKDALTTSMTTMPAGLLRSLTCPAHIHFEISAPGMRMVATTHVFVDGSPSLGSDAVFGVKDSLVRAFRTVDDASVAAEVGLPNPFRTVGFDVVLMS